MIKFIYFLLLVLLCKTQLTAQEKVYIHYKIEDGLLSNRIYTIKQDKRGFIWIATDNGLCRFDGQRFKRYTTSNGLPDNDILGIEIDNHDRVWITTYNRNICYLFQDKIVSSLNDSNLAKYSFTSYLSLHGKSNRHIYFSEPTLNGRYKINENGQISQDSLNTRFLFLGDKYVRYNKYKIQLFSLDDEFINEKLLDSINFNKIEVFDKNDSNFTIKCSSGFYNCSIQNARIAISKVEAQIPPSSISFYRNKKLWSLNENMVLSNNESDTNRNEFVRLQRVTVTEFFIDNKGGYWVGTKGDGLYYYPNISLEWFNETSGLLHPNITSSFNYKNELFFVSSDSRIEKLSQAGKQEVILNVSKDCKGVINSLFINDDYIVCGSDIGQLYVYSKRLKSFYVDPAIGSIKDIKAGFKNTILLATSAKLQTYNLENHSMKDLFGGRSTKVQFLNDSTLIVGGVNRISLLFLKKQYQKEIEVKEIGNFNLNNTTISDIQLYKKFLVIGTIERGLIIWNGTQFQQITTKNGLSDNLCRKIFIDSSGIVWVSTMSGINVLKFNSSMHDFTIRQINTKHGLVTNNISSIQRVEDMMYATTSQGVLKFPFNIMEVELDTPNVFVSSIRIRNQNISTSEDRIMIPADSNYVSIEFSAIDYKSLGHISYYYRLKGVNDYWKKFDKVLSLERLKPGEYALEVRAVNSKNIQSIHNPILKIEVMPYWWQRSLFKWILAIGLAILVYLLTRAILNKQYQKKLDEESMKKHLTEVELRALKAQINPHFIFNTLNAIQYFIQNNENEKADLYLNKMSKLIRSTLNYSNESSIPLQEEIAYLRTYLDLESLRFDDNFRYEIIEHYPDSMDSFLIPTMVLQPHVENAIRHGLKPKKKGSQVLLLRFYIEQVYLVCEIDDNGIGRANSMKMKEQNQKLHNSQGISLSDSKLDIFKKITQKDVTIQIIDKYDEGEPSGTTLKLSIHL